MRPARRDRGQVLIITAFAMVVLIAIAAIVVDLGFSWMLHRKEQNAADPGALAAAKWIRDVPASGTQQDAREAEACFYARENGFFPNATQDNLGPSGCVKANDPNGTVLTVNYPPATSMAGQFQGHLGYVEVIIYSTHLSFFGQFFGDPLADVTTEAVAALTDGQSTTGSLVALGADCNAAGGDGLQWQRFGGPVDQRAPQSTIRFHGWWLFVPGRWHTAAGMRGCVALP